MEQWWRGVMAQWRYGRAEQLMELWWRNKERDGNSRVREVRVVSRCLKRMAFYFVQVDSTTTEKNRTCSILFDIPPTSEKKDYVGLRVFAVYEANTNGSVSTRVTKVLDPHNASRYQCRRSCFSHFESRNRGNYYLVSRITHEKEIVGGERIEVCFEIAPSACIVVKMCQLQLSYGTCTGDFSIDTIHGRKIGFDLVETSGGLANKDYDSKRSSIIWEDINNEGCNEYIFLCHSTRTGGFIIGRSNLDINSFKRLSNCDGIL
ncbi:hypothetical protein LguiA_030236 [Lonicera macranthoides]